MMHFLPAGAACIVDSLAGLPGGNDEWRLLDETDDGICLWTRDKESSTIREVAAAAVIDASPEAIGALILDCPRYPQIFRYVEVCEVVREHDDGAWVFQQLDFPLGASDRYYTIDLRSKSLAGGGVEVSWTLVDAALSGRRGDGVATLANDGRWQLRPAAGGRGTSALYYLFTDPGGRLFDWVVNMGNRQALPDVIRDLRSAVE
jgi:hypothetical protein